MSTTVDPNALNQQFNSDMGNLQDAVQTENQANAQLKADSAALGTETGQQQYLGALKLLYDMMQYVGDVLGVYSDESLVVNDLQDDVTGIQSLNEQMMSAGGAIWQAQQQVNADQAYLNQLNNDPNATAAQKTAAQNQLTADQANLTQVTQENQPTLDALTPTMISMMQTYQSNLTACKPYMPSSVYDELQTNLGNIMMSLSNGGTSDPNDEGPYFGMTLQQSIPFMYENYLSTTPPSTEETSMLNSINGSASILSSVSKQQMIIEQNYSSRYTQMISLISKINGNINNMNNVSVNNQTKGG